MNKRETRPGPKPQPNKPTPKKIYRPDEVAISITDKVKKEYASREGDIFDAPFITDRDRIRYNTERLKTMSIAEAFAEDYGVLIRVPATEELPANVEVGSIVKLKIQSITKRGGVVFDSGIHKETFTTRNNLAHFSKLIRFLPVEPVDARVVEVTPKGCVVDIYGPMIEKFIQPRAERPWIQNQVDGNAEPITVKNLKLVRGGYLGQAVIPNISDFVGEDFVIDAFVPGSQIVQNTTDDFTKFEGKSVETFIVTWSKKPGGKGMSLICSAKNRIKHIGFLKMREIHSWWCDAGSQWADFAKVDLDGVITGIINSSKKCGVFVELPDYEMTGMINVKQEDLVNYKAGEHIKVHFAGFDEDLYYNEDVGQYQHKPAFEIEDGAIKKVNIKPIFVPAE